MVAEQPERQEFVDRDLIGAVFWSVDLTGAEFEDVNLSEVSISRAKVCNVTIDGLVDNLKVNGVDVTAFVNQHDPWFPLRAMVDPPDPAGMRAAWQALDERWTSTIADARRLSDQRLHERVNDEWSFVDTLRHLVFCIDKWFFAPVLGAATFQPIGLPNTGSTDFGWPGLDLTAGPAIDVVVADASRAGPTFRRVPRCARRRRSRP